MGDRLEEREVSTRRMAAVLLLRALLENARVPASERPALLAAIGTSPSVLEDVNGWIPVDVMARAWQLVPAWSGDPDFGMHAAEKATTGTYGALEYATLSSTSLDDALKRAVRYYHVLGAMSDPVVVERGPRTHLILKPRLAIPAGDARHFVEHFFALLVTRARQLAEQGLTLLHARFVHAAPGNTTEHARIFGPAVEFGARENEIVVDRARLSVPLRTANPALLEPLEAAAASVLRRADEDIVARTRAVVPEVLKAGEPGLMAVARRLGIGARTLQRRLGQQGGSYASIVDDVRRDLAQREVAAGDKSFGEIAFLLGFSQASAFDRAFRRWTGSTPSAYRRARRSKLTESDRA
jgi:AraC-like DNA-binding protein